VVAAKEKRTEVIEEGLEGVDEDGWYRY